MKALRQHMPICWKSPNHIDPRSTFTAFLISVLVGARRFAHASLLRGDRALHALLGLERFPTGDTIRNLFFVHSAWARSSACRNHCSSGASRGVDEFLKEALAVETAPEDPLATGRFRLLR